MSDRAISEVVGARMRALRLRRNKTQQQVADATAISLNAIKALEAGRAKLTTLIAVLRELGALEGVDGLAPELSISPLQLAKRQGRVRQRASGKRGQDAAEKKGPSW